ncbi:MAG: MBOAT family protein [Lachnospiraceae bacterium]|nr:MBOAT family protein [Lachnospiraceae bacterium]
MTLTSVSFFAFVFATLVVYYSIPKKFRWIVLLAASTAFYAIVCLKYMPFIVFTAITTWLGALWLDKVTNARKEELKLHKTEWDSDTKKAYKHKTLMNKRWILTFVLVLNFGILAFIKYFDFLAEWISGLLHTPVLSLGILLPLGISFYTFQSMGYIIDVYWGKTTPEKNFAKFALFVSFFPQIIQGPIAIYDDLAKQLYEGHDLQYENVKNGFILILWGLFKKMVIADRLIVILNAILDNRPGLYNYYGAIAILVYAAQLYMDFSGGIDISRGVAQMLGINMAENFKRPFFSRTVAGFWRRWHISLCHWLRTYLFYPIAVSKSFLHLGKWIGKHAKKTEEDLPADSLWGGFTFMEHAGRVIPGCIATLIIFLIIGMWHGANWRYAGYGLWNGIIIFISMLLEPAFRYLLKKLKINTQSFGWIVWQILRTFLITMVGFAFDIGNNMSDSARMVLDCFHPFGMASTVPVQLSIGLKTSDYVIIGIGLLIVFAVSLYQECSQKSARETLIKQPLWLQWVIMIGCLLCIVILGMYGPGVAANEFVYMNF